MALLRTILGLASLLGLLSVHTFAQHPFTEEEKDWWAIQALSEAEPPKAGETWARNAIDRFIARKHVSEDLKPAAEAEPIALLRRATFDLHGLPPSPAQIQAFLDDERPDAFERLIDELLASPRYGEHWAQHWLDVVRYSETDGYRADFFRPGAYRYRDWVVRALNKDMPYDDFVRAQLAGDENADLFDDPLDARVATGYLRHGVYEHNQRDARGHWQLILDEVTRTTGEAFLGLGIGCAQCHDHKFDPILQKDYVALQSYFTTMAWPVDEVAASPLERETYAAALAGWKEATAPIRYEMDGMLAKTRSAKARTQVKQFPPDIQEMYAKPAADQTPFEAQMAALVQRQVNDQVKGVSGSGTFKKDKEQLARWKELEDTMKIYAEMKPDPLSTLLAATDIAAVPVEATLKTRGEERVIEPGLLTILNTPAPEVKRGKHTTGRRSALADWITEEDNPLATRVIVNRLWQHHFGTGLVATPNDFGTLGAPPSHPELLDWLARELVREEWRLKAVHRLIMTSSTYRLSTRAADGHGDGPPALLTRTPERRLTAEQVRDAMLAVSGELDLRVGGKSVSGQTPRRSVYVTRRRNTPDPLLAAFDAPTGFESAPTRQNTATPTQSLLLSNHPWPQQRAKAFADRLLKKSTEPDALVEAAYLAAFGREPKPDELETARAYLKSNTTALKKEAPPPKAPSGAFLPVAKTFPKLENFGLGSHAVRLGPNNPSGAVQVMSNWEDSDFTIQTVARLDTIHANANVNTLASRWRDKNGGKPGWTFGVTSKRSAYQPRNLIMQLVGENKNGNISYEVVDSNIEVPLGVPVFLAAVVRTKEGGGSVTFYAKDLSKPDSAMMVNVVRHGMVGAIQDPAIPCLLGTRDQKNHHFDGSLARVKITSNLFRTEQLLPFAPDEEGTVILDWTFHENAKAPTEGAAWFGETSAAEETTHSHRADALTDLCHALLISNEFLYLD